MKFLRLIKATAVGWYRNNPFQHAAALAFYGAFALAPLLYLAISIAGMIYGEDAAQGQLVKTLTVALRPAVAEAIAESLTYVHVERTAISPTLIGLGLVIFAVTSMLVQLQTSLNAIWGVRPKQGSGLWGMLRRRFFAFALVVGVGILLLLLLGTNAALVAMHHFVPEASWTSGVFMSEGVKWASLLGLHTLLFAMIYKLLPDAIISWRDTFVGALVTAILLMAGNYLIGYYLGTIAPAFAYWAASSLVVLMLWVYYSSQVLLFGAEFTKNYAAAVGRPVRPAGNAIYLP